METLKELVQILTESERKSKVTRRMAKNVYHRDYVKTKNRPYRKYHKGRGE